MAVFNYNDLKLSKSKKIKIFKWADKEIEILDYLPFEDKYDIIMITIQKSYENGIYNPMKLDMFYHLNLVYAFTNLIFSDEDRQDESKLYDELVSSGFMEAFLQHLDMKVYTEMQEDIENIIKLKTKYDLSIAGMIKTFVEDLPTNAEAIQQIIDNFDPDKYQAVVDFAKAANGGRPIS